jgi:hypothetical protein
MYASSFKLSEDVCKEIEPGSTSNGRDGILSHAPIGLVGIKIAWPKIIYTQITASSVK